MREFVNGCEYEGRYHVGEKRRFEYNGCRMDARRSPT